ERSNTFCFAFIFSLFLPPCPPCHRGANFLHVIRRRVGRLPPGRRPVRGRLAHPALLVAARPPGPPTPPPVPHLRHVLAVLDHVPPVLDPLLPHRLQHVRRPLRQPRHPVDHVHHQVVPVQVVEH